MSVDDLCPKCKMNRKMMTRNTCMICREPSEIEAGDSFLGPPTVPCEKCGAMSYTGVCYKCEFFEAENAGWKISK